MTGTTVSSDLIGGGNVLTGIIIMVDCAVCEDTMAVESSGGMPNVDMTCVASKDGGSIDI